MTKYYEVEGKIFKDENEALEYEKSLEEKKAAESEKKKQMEDDLAGIQDMYDNLIKRMSDYIDKYEKPIHLTSKSDHFPNYDWNDFFREFFD